MNELMEYDGRTYRRGSSMWLDENNLAVPAYLQHILNTLLFRERDLSSISYSEAKTEGDKFKKSESYSLAVRYYERAIELSEQMSGTAAILPRITSCYRKLGKPRRVIELMTEAKRRWGEDIVSEVLLTSVAAAYCDVGEPENAIRCCKWAHKILRSKTNEISPELSNVYERASRMIDPDYDREESILKSEMRAKENELRFNKST